MAVYARRRHTTIGSIIRGIATVFAVILLLHILFVLLGANAANGFVRFIANWANVLAVWFRNLFATGSPSMDVLLNYGMALVFWVVVLGLLSRIADRTT